MFYVPRSAVHKQRSSPFGVNAMSFVRAIELTTGLALRGKVEHRDANACAAWASTESLEAEAAITFASHDCGHPTPSDQRSAPFAFQQINLATVSTQERRAGATRETSAGPSTDAKLAAEDAAELEAQTVPEGPICGEMCCCPLCNDFRIGIEVLAADYETDKLQQRHRSSKAGTVAAPRIITRAKTSTRTK